MPIRWGIIGCGDVTEVKSGPGFQKAEGSELVAVMRRDAARAEDYARRHNAPHWFADSEALIHCPDVDAVYVATPPGSHLHYALAVCEAGKPCYIEKPMARNATECNFLLTAFGLAKIPLFVAYYRRALPRFLRVKEWLDGGRIGAPVSVSYIQAAGRDPSLDPQNLPWRLKAQDAGGGIFLDVGCHTLDILDFLLGPLENVKGNATRSDSRYAVEDAVIMTFTTAQGFAGKAEWDFTGARPNADKIVIEGEDGKIALSTFGNDPIELHTKDGIETFERPNPPHIQQPLIQNIVDELYGVGKCQSTGTTAARTSRVMDAVLSSYYSGREDAFWMRPETWKKF